MRKGIVEKLFAIPISWILAVPIVLVDRLLSVDPAELSGRDATARYVGSSGNGVHQEGHESPGSTVVSWP